MILVFVLSIICKMALYMIAVNVLVYFLTFSFYELAGHLRYFYYLSYDLQTRAALFEGGHPLLISVLHNFLPLLVTSIAAPLAYWLNNVRPWLRFIPMVLLSLCFFPLFMFPLGSYPIQNMATALFLLVPFIYLIVEISFRQFSADTGALRRNIKRSIIIVSAVTLVIVLFSGVDHMWLFSTYYLHYGIVFFVCAFGLLRIARVPKEMLSDPKFIAISLVPIVVTILLLLASQQIASVIWHVVRFVGLNIITPVINFLARGITWFFSLFYTHDPATAPPIDFIYDPGNETTVNYLPFLEILMHTHILAGFFTILLAGVAYKALKAILRRKQKHTKNGLTEERSHVVSASKKSAETHTGHKYGFFTPRDPRMAVRYHYRRFLKLCAEKGVSPELGDTSEEVNAKNQKNFPGASMARLRTLYIKARYSQHDIDKSESKEVEELVKKGLGL